MKAPLSWLKEYVEIKSNLKELMWRLTEVGVTCESYEDVSGDKVLDVEVTPNRPDWLSITGIAREIALTQKTKLKMPQVKEFPRPSADLPVKISFRTNLTGGYAGITIEGVKVTDSPKWMADRLIAVGLRPINNLVDITNYVMFELGIPIHVFDYDKFLNKDLTMTLSKGGETFESVDEIKYKLPANTLVIKDVNRVIDLCGIKGGANTGITKDTKNIFIHAPIYDGAYIRKTSQTLKLRSDASYIYERGPSPAGVEQTLKRVVSLVLELAGGRVASTPIIKIDENKQKYLTLDLKNLQSFLGQEIKKEEVTNILQMLEFNPKFKGSKIECSTPYFRSDIKTKEDLYEEIARIHGYNNFSRTLPNSGTTAVKIPYLYDREFELQLKNIVASISYFEINSGALTSKVSIENSQLNPDIHIRIANPVSAEYEYMRTSLMPSLLSGIKSNTEAVNLFEFGKVYFAPVDNASEVYKISGAVKTKKFGLLKGHVDFLLDKLGIKTVEIKPFSLSHGLWHPTHAAVIEKDGDELGTFGELNTKVLRNFGIKEAVFGFELDVANLKKHQKQYVFNPIPKFPPQIEDLTFTLKGETKIGEIIQSIKSVKLVEDVKFLDTYENSVSVRVYYSDPRKTLSDKEVKEIRKEIINQIVTKYKIQIKI